jgi:hypothetical protein
MGSMSIKRNICKSSMKGYAILLIHMSMLFLFGETASAQYRTSEKIKPQWLHKLPKPGNSSFMYETVSVSASSLDNAREKCLAELIANSGLKNGVVAIFDNKSSERLSQIWNNGKLTERIEYDSHTTTHAQYDAIKLHVENIAEYWEQDRSGSYYLTKLYAKSELGTAPLFDNIELTTRYGARGLWRSAIIPGWGQFHKGAHLKGGLILGGCAALAAGIVFTENQRADYMRKIAQTHDVNQIKNYSTKSDHFATARNICIGAAAALYLYNLIDAVAAPGARRIVVHHRGAAGRTYAFTPAVLPDGTAGMVAAVTF